MTLRLLRAGWSSVQDLGRPGYAAAGVPRGGAFDEWALRAGNRLVGNEDGAAAIEFALRAPAVRFEAGAVVALTGARFERDLDGAEPPHGEAFRVPAGATLALGRVHAGARGYLSVRGGIATPRMLSSRSASPRAGIGAMLADGALLAAGEPRDAGAPLRRLAHPVEALGDAVLRAVAGPQDDAFTVGARRTFFDEPFTVSAEADRVGVRLDGARLAHTGEAGIEPEGVVPGAVQVPGDGRPIVLGPDGPATGGYAKIAVVCSADLCVIAQARPGTTLRFEETSVEAAREARLVREHALDAAIEAP